MYPQSVQSILEPPTNYFTEDCLGYIDVVSDFVQQLLRAATQL